MSQNGKNSKLRTQLDDVVSGKVGAGGDLLKKVSTGGPHRVVRTEDPPRGGGNSADSRGGLLSIRRERSRIARRPAERVFDLGCSSTFNKTIQALVAVNDGPLRDQNDSLSVRGRIPLVRRQVRV